MLSLKTKLSTCLGWMASFFALNVECFPLVCVCLTYYVLIVSCLQILRNNSDAFASAKFKTKCFFSTPPQTFCVVPRRDRAPAKYDLFPSFGYLTNSTKLVELGKRAKVLKPFAILFRVLSPL